MRCFVSPCLTVAKAESDDLISAGDFAVGDSATQLQTASTGSDATPGWAIALMVLSSMILLALVIVVVQLFRMY
jgi:hypothetical protein